MPNAPDLTVIAGVHNNRTPHKIFLLVACVLAGVIGLFFPHTHAQSIEAAFHGNSLLIWYTGLLIGGVLGLAGVFRRTITGVLIEQSGMLLLAGLMLSFAVAAIAYSGVRGIVGLTILTGFGIANIVRAWQIRHDLTLIRRYLAALPAPTTLHKDGAADG